MSVRRNSVLIARYGYDVLGRRIVKRVYSSASGGTVGYTRFVYKGSHVSFETDSAGTIGLRYTWGAGTDDVVAITTAAGQHYYVTTDKLGSVRSIAKRDGTWQLSQRFDPYGRLIVRDSASGSTIGAQLRYGWTGREWDAETGFSYHRARYFDLGSRRWTQEDPIGYAGGMNVYAYVGGSPMESRDPSGAIPSEDGVTSREYDKVLTMPMQTWDGWFGISGTMLPTLYTRVLINLTEVAILPGRPSDNLWVKELYESAPSYEDYVAAYGGHVANHAARYNDMFFGDSALSRADYTRLLVTVAVASQAYSSRGATFGAELYGASVNRLTNGMVFVNSTYVAARVATDGRSRNAVTFLYTVLDGTYASGASSGCLASTLIHETLHVPSYQARYGDPDVGAAWIQQALVFGYKC